MARCNELGMGENRALRKSEKTSENLKKMKVPSLFGTIPAAWIVPLMQVQVN